MRKLATVTAISCSFIAGIANADVKFNGVASIIASQANVGSMFGYGTDIGFKPESRLVLQSSAELMDGFTATTQILAKRSNFLSIWGSSGEGIETIVGESEDEVQDLTGMNLTLNYDWLSFRVGYLRSETTIGLQDSELDPALQTLNILSSFDAQAVTHFVTSEDALLINVNDAASFGVGFSIDYNDWLMNAEYTELRSEDPLLALQDSAYISVGHRFDGYVLYLSYRLADDDYYTEALELLVGSAIPAEVPGTGGLRSENIVNGILGATQGLKDGAEQGPQSELEERDYYSFGVRYDFHPAAALKVDYTLREDNKTDSDRNVISIGVDLVF